MGLNREFSIEEIKKWLRIEILPGWFSFYPAFLGVSTKTEFYSFVFKTSLEFEDQHMF